MTDSTLNIIIKVLKVTTWLSIAATIFFIFQSFKTNDHVYGQDNTFNAIIALGAGYFSNFLKWIDIRSTNYKKASVINFFNVIVFFHINLYLIN